MNVDEFQLHLNNLSNLLRRAGGKKVADEMDEFCLALRPYSDRRMKDLVAMIAKAETITQNGGLPAKPKGKAKKKSDPAAISDAVQRVRNLFERATDASVSREEIETACSELDSIGVPKPALESLARELMISEKLPNKTVIIDRIRQAILTRKGTFQRSHI